MACAADSTQAQAKAAKKACAAGDFRKGVDILAGLYVDTNKTTHIYNQGRCYEQNHQWASAIDRFREYLRKSDNLSARDRADAEKHLADCEAFLERQEPKLAPPPQAVVLAVTPPPPTPPPPVSAVITTQAAPAASAGSSGAGLRVAGVVLGAVGVAALATGVVLNLKADSLANEYNRSHDQNTRSSQSSYETGSIIGYAGGGGFLVVGAVLYLIGLRSADDRPANVALLPLLAREQFSLTIQGSF